MPCCSAAGMKTISLPLESGRLSNGVYFISILLFRIFATPIALLIQIRHWTSDVRLSCLVRAQAVSHGYTLHLKTNADRYEGFGLMSEVYRHTI
jgi:hypothetical protein